LITQTDNLNVQRLGGVMLPVVTSFAADGELNAPALTRNLQQWSATGISGIVVLGSTGERVHLDESEYIETIQTGRAATSGDLAFIVGAGQQSTFSTIQEVRRAAQAGADAVLVITPSFYRSSITQEALFKHYNAVADASPVPVILYSMPALTGIKIEPATSARLSEHPNIIGVKDSSADIGGFKETVELCPNEFAVMTGNGTVFLDALRAGATGAILAVGCAVPEICVEIQRAFRAGDDENAEQLQKKLGPLAAAVTTKYGIGGLKAALDMNGYVGGSVRAPLQLPDAQAKAEIAQLLDDAKTTLQDLTAVGREA
jgi:4-hydroxy-2-oxoglutarate aldolase